MRSSDQSLCSFAVWLVISCGIAATAAGQVPVKSKSAPATLLGRTIDTAGAALGDAEVVVTLTRSHLTNAEVG
jgi:uncharacterized membrane-anchored protein